MNTERIEELIKELIIEIGDDPNRHGLIETPFRVAKMYQEIFSGYHNMPENTIKQFIDTKHGDGIVIRDIPFYSVCEHHIMPFWGMINIAYIPSGETILGLSKFSRIVDYYSKKLQLQECLGQQICDSIMEEIQACGVMVLIKAEHLCMSMRGVKKPGVNTVTTVSRGLFKDNYQLRMEYLSLLNM